MDLPPLNGRVTDVELAVTLFTAAHVLEREGRKALSGSVFGAGSRMRMTAAALNESAAAVLNSTVDLSPRDHAAFAEARHSLVALAGFLSWEDERLRSYWEALGALMSADARARENGWTSPGDAKICDQTRLTESTCLFAQIHESTSTGPTMPETWLGEQVVLPWHIQDLVDEVIAGLGDASRIARHPALEQLTSWLSRDDHMVETLVDQSNWLNGVDSDWIVQRCQSADVAETAPADERLRFMRNLVERAFNGDIGVLGDEYPVHCVVALRTRSGQTAILGCLFAASCWNADSPITWEDGLFASIEDYRRWLRVTKDLCTRMADFDALTVEQQLSLIAR